MMDTIVFSFVQVSSNIFRKFSFITASMFECSSSKCFLYIKCQNEDKIKFRLHRTNDVCLKMVRPFRTGKK
ncbi:hypothetical protein PGB90_009036 [Kerria lacca]